MDMRPDNLLNTHKPSLDSNIINSPIGDSPSETRRQKLSRFRRNHQIDRPARTTPSNMIKCPKLRTTGPNTCQGNTSIMFISASQGLEIMFFYFFIFFHFDHHFFGLKIIIPFLSPLSFFIIFSFLFFLPLAFSFFFPLLRKWSLVLGNCHQRLFLEPFSSVFSIAFAL